MRAPNAKAGWRRGVPRWVFEVWLWLTVAAVAFFDFGCDSKALGSICLAMTNWGWPLLALPPGALDELFFGLFANRLAALAATAGCASVGHLLLRRFVPRRVPWGWALLTYVICLVLTGVTFFVGLYLDFFARNISFWAYLRGAWRLLTEK